jgi:[protein-PII] uridylyltransferase
MISSEVQALRAFIIERREKLLGVEPAATPGRDWLREYSELLDETLRRIYRAAWDAARRTHDFANGPSENSLALLAIGGYGRGDLCPHSDIDIAFIPVEEENPLIDAVIKEAFRLIVEVLIDGAKLDVGYAYRPLSDIEHLDTTGKTALVEARLLAGPEGLLARVKNELHRKWDAVAFLLDIARERREIAAHAPLSLYAVEPHVKEGAGALRDIHTVVWVTDAMLQSQPALLELEWRGFITAQEVAHIENAREFFLRLRLWLHLSTHKKTDVLRIDLQHRCALDFGCAGEGAIASQQLLREYYRHGERVSRVLEKLLRQLLAGPLALDGHFLATGGRLHPAHPHALSNHPELIVTPFVLAHKYGFSFAPELDRAIENALPLISEETRRHTIMRASLRALLGQPEATAGALAGLREQGVLQALLPEFEAVLHLAPGDPSHQLSVGEHSLQTVRILLESWKTRREREEVFNIWAGCDDIEVLVLATLLHDVGKSQIGTDHSQSGAKIAREIAERLGFSSERSERVAFLVRQHLLLPRVARLRDLSSPATILQVLEIVPDVNTLKMLYLLSVADTRAVGERTYSPLDLQVMRELYDKVLLAMTRDETAEALTDAEKREQLAQRERAALRRAVRRSDVALDENALHRLCEDLPASYVLNTPLTTIVTHLQLLDQLPQEGLLVDYNDDERGLSTEVTIVTCDDPQPGLLSKVCGVMHALGVEILAAQVHTLRGMAPEQFEDSSDSSAQLLVPATRGDIVLDRLQVEMSGRALSETKRARLSAALRAVLCDGKNVEELLREAGKNIAQPLSVQRVSARNDLSDEHTVVTIVSDNVPGLMYFLTRGLAEVGLDIHTAKITGWSGRAEDAFYVTSRPERDGVKGGAGAGERAGKIRNDAIPGVLQALTAVLEKNKNSKNE